MVFTDKSITHIKPTTHSCLGQQMCLERQCSPFKISACCPVCVLSLWRWTQKVSGSALHPTCSRCFLSSPFTRFHTHLQLFRSPPCVSPSAVLHVQRERLWWGTSMQGLPLSLLWLNSVYLLHLFAHLSASLKTVPSHALLSPHL